MRIKQQTVNSMYRINWGIYHLVGRFYLVRKYSPATKGLRHYIWVVNYVRREEDE